MENPEQLDSNPTSAQILSDPWLKGPLGQHLLRCEEHIVSQALERAFGFQLLQIGTWGESDRFVQHSKTLRHSILGNADSPGISVVAQAAELPIATDSVDVVILPHTLEKYPDPHHTLREVHRILVGEGHLIVLGFSPLSLWGLRQKTVPGIRLTPSQPMITEHRLCDWLSLLGLESIKCEKYFYSLPFNRQSVLSKTARLEQAGRRWWPFLNGAYMLVAKKSLMRVAMVGPRWHVGRRVVGGMAETASRTADAVARTSE